MNNTANIKMLPPLYFAIGLVPGILVELFLDLPDNVYRYSVVGPGILIVAMSIVLAIWSVKTLKSNNTAIHIREPVTALANHGPYRISRNPLYLSLLLLIVGFILLFEAYLILLSIPIIVFIVNNQVIRKEEILLSGLFKENYQDYCKRVRRWI